MAGTETAAPEGRRVPAEGVFGPRRKRRLGIRIDMTPMVDIAFLLLIFFMVTTVFRRPLAMEINMPKSDAKVEVPEGNVMTIFIQGDDSMVYRLGTAGLAPIAWNALRPTFEEQMKRNPNLIVLVKISRDARYDDMVNMMDTLEDAHMDRFSLVPMTDQDVKMLEKKP